MSKVKTMNDETEDSMYIDPEILKKELVISLPILTESDIEMMMRGDDSSSEESSSDERGKEKPCLKRDQRRISLLNDPNYGIILSFINLFREHMGIKCYSSRIFEDNLINEQGKISRRYIDFHLALLKKIVPVKATEPENFSSSMTKFAYRYNRDDGDHLEQHGYSKARIDVKLRILRDLLEKQFERNSTLKTSITNKTVLATRLKPFGRDRFGASYWLFTDTDCFLRLFRENIDEKRTWINLAKNRDELENLIKLLITDSTVRKKFPEWKFSLESLNSLPPSNDFESQYAPSFPTVKKKTESLGELSPISAVLHPSSVKIETVDLNPTVNLDRDITLSPPQSSFLITNTALDVPSDQESCTSMEITGNRPVSSLSSSSSTSSNDTIDSVHCSQELNENASKTTEIETIEISQIIPSETNHNDGAQAIVFSQGIKRKLVDYDDSESEMEDNESNDHSHQAPIHQAPPTNTELPIALRRSRRTRGQCSAELSLDSSSASQSSSSGQSTYRTRNTPHRTSRNKSRGGGGRRRRGNASRNGFSSTTSDEHAPSIDEDDDLYDDCYPNNTELDLLLTGDLLEEDEDDDDSLRPRAKTVAHCQTPPKPCLTCLQTNHPDCLLLCEDCDDAYHLECVQPELLAVPDHHWYCPVCEHKQLCDGLIEKLTILIQDEREFEMKHRLFVSKRRKRLTNVAVNLDRFVKQTTNKRQANIILSSEEDEDNGDKTKGQQSSKKIDLSDDDDDDDDSVYGQKALQLSASKAKEEAEEEEAATTGKSCVRRCRRKAQNYSYDDYDKKFKDAGIVKGAAGNDSDDSDEIVFKRKVPSKRARYEEDDDDFDVSKRKNNDAYDDFVPSQRRTINNDSRSNTKENDNNDFEDFNDYDDDMGMSDDDTNWRDRRHSSVSSSLSKKKSNQKSNCNNRQKSPVISDEDTIPYDPNLNDLPPALPPVKIKSEPITEFDKNAVNPNVLNPNQLITGVFNPNQVGTNIFTAGQIGKNILNAAVPTGKTKYNKRQRSKKAASTAKNPSNQQENISEEEDGRPPPSKQKPRRKRLGSADSPVEDDDDYEKLAHKRRLFHHGKAITRRSITAHIKKLVGGDDDEDEEDGDGVEGDTNEKSSNKTKKDANNNNSKKKNQNSDYPELRLSDDDDFPDDVEILKTTGLRNLKPPTTGHKPVPLRAPFMPSMQSYQYAMMDPTANFDLTCTPDTQPSESTEANGEPAESTTT